MTASNHFLEMHDVARSIKNKHDIDIMIPHGVAIKGKMYPAINKHLTLDNYSPNFGFEIPFENGQILNMIAFRGSDVDDVSAPPAVYADVLFPHENGGHRLLQHPKMGFHPKMEFNTLKHGTTDNLIDKINKWSTQPLTVVRGGLDHELEIVPPEELHNSYQKHIKNKTSKPRPQENSNLIAVSQSGESLYWTYNISTEEFKSTARHPFWKYK